MSIAVYERRQRMFLENFHLLVRKPIYKRVHAEFFPLSKRNSFIYFFIVGRPLQMTPRLGQGRKNRGKIFRFSRRRGGRFLEWLQCSWARIVHVENIDECFCTVQCTYRKRRVQQKLDHVWCLGDWRKIFSPFFGTSTCWQTILYLNFETCRN